MNANNEALRKLIAGARKAHLPSPTDESAAAPFGFATRVAGCWAATPRRSVTDLWERLCWWGAGASVAVCLVALVSQSLRPEPNPLDVLLEASADLPNPVM